MREPIVGEVVRYVMYEGDRASIVVGISPDNPMRVYLYVFPSSYGAGFVTPLVAYDVTIRGTGYWHYMNDEYITPT